MSISTVWILEQDQFDATDAAWCRGLDVTWITEPLLSNTYSQGKLAESKIRGWRIRLTTTSEEQEGMLRLKYGSRLHEVHRFDQLPAGRLTS